MKKIRELLFNRWVLGALVVLENHLAVGVNKGGSPIAFACPIGPVLAKLNATLAT